MRMKRVLLASSALALLAGAGTAQAGDAYISVLGGANWVEDSSGATPLGSTGFSSDADTGFMIGGAIGTSLDNWLKGLRAELEVSYRRNDVGGTWFSIGSYGAIDANLSTFAIMANLWYDIDVGSKVRPYAGGGIGWARTRLDGALLTSSGYSAFSTTVTDQAGFAWQLGLGFNYEVMQDVDVGLGYRYFSTENIATSTIASTLENDNHTVFVNLTIGIN